MTGENILIELLLSNFELVTDEYLFTQLRHLSHQPIQASLLRNSHEYQVCHAHGCQESEHASCFTADLYQSLCRVRYVIRGQHRYCFNYF